MPNDLFTFYWKHRILYCVSLVGSVFGPGTTGVFWRSELETLREVCGSLEAGNEPMSVILPSSKTFA